MGCVVQTDGACDDIRVTKALDESGLDREAMKALEQWRFKPGTRGGKPVPVEVTVEMAFNLK
jgi:protein TonB